MCRGDREAHIVLSVATAAAPREGNSGRGVEQGALGGLRRRGVLVGAVLRAPEVRSNEVMDAFDDRLSDEEKGRDELKSSPVSKRCPIHPVFFYFVAPLCATTKVWRDGRSEDKRGSEDYLSLTV